MCDASPGHRAEQPVRALNKEEQSAYHYAMEHSDMQGPCGLKCWRWKVYGGLGKYLSARNVCQSCGGAVDALSQL